MLFRVATLIVPTSLDRVSGIFFFEGNVAAYRTPRRMFLTPELCAEFISERGF